MATDKLTWPGGDFSAAPYWFYRDAKIFQLEMERVFRGTTWNYLGLECEIRKPGDYLTGYVGTTPVVLSRSQDGGIHAFVNRCAHRGMQVVRELRGNQARHQCPYHHWCYDSRGDLIGVPLLHGANGRGGLPDDFRMEENGLRKLRTATYCGVVFGTLSAAAPPLEEYLGPAITERMRYTLDRPLEVTGYHRHTIRANWKLFSENARDAYHAPLLHPFLPTFGLMRPTDVGKSQVDRQGFHSLISVWSNVGDAAAKRGAEGSPTLTLEDPSLVRGFQEYPDGLSLSIISVFPNALFTYVGNAHSVRQIRPKSPGVVDLLYTYFTFADDDAEKRAMRRKQTNLFGPAGYVAMEDAEALELIQAGIVRGEDRTRSTIAMGGRTVEDQDHIVTEVSIRGFWKGYCRIMDIPMQGQAT